MDDKHYFKGKKVTLMGLGLLGRGVGDAAFLASCGADLIVTDLRTEDALSSSLTRLAPFASIRYTLGKHVTEDFRDRDLIIKGAGVPYDSPYIQEALDRGIPVRMSTELFLELSGLFSVGVTGTRGKTTTTCLIADILEAAGRKVVRGGNLRSVSTLALLPHVTPEHIAVLELDSWQLQGFGDAGRSPDVAVFTSWYPDHQQYYRNDLERYFADKAHIFSHQGTQGLAVLAPQARTHVAARVPEVAARAQVPDPVEFSSWETKLLGQHNLENIACAVATARALGIADEVSRSVVARFCPLPGRLELLGEVHGIRIFNDAMAIIPDATVAALAALSDSPVILIMGGGDKRLANADLVRAVGAHTKHVVLLAGSGTDTIREHFPTAQVHTRIESALNEALSKAEKGDAVLFSPAFSSKGLFRDAYDRSDQFIDCVSQYG